MPLLRLLRLYREDAKGAAEISMYCTVPRPANWIEGFGQTGCQRLCMQDVIRRVRDVFEQHCNDELMIKQANGPFAWSADECSMLFIFSFMFWNEFFILWNRPSDCLVLLFFGPWRNGWSRLWHSLTAEPASASLGLACKVPWVLQWPWVRYYLFNESASCTSILTKNVRPSEGMARAQ